MVIECLFMLKFRCLVRRGAMRVVMVGAYEVARWLKAHGFQKVYVPLGGISFPRRWGEEVR
jgi:hypothetical protein